MDTDPLGYMMALVPNIGECAAELQFALTEPVVTDEVIMVCRRLHAIGALAYEAERRIVQLGL